MTRLLILLFAVLAVAHAAMVTTTPAGLQKRLERARRPTGWQKRLDKALLGVDKTPKQRIQLLKKVGKDAKAIASDVRVAVAEVQEKGIGKGHPLVLDLLFPTGTTARADLEGVAALRKQVPELLSTLKPPTADELDKLRQQAKPPPDPLTVAKAAATLVTDPKKREELAEEAKNALRSTPKGLETPKYRVVRSFSAGEGALDGSVELRAYEPFTVAKKAMGEGATSIEGGGAGFNALASYLFGGNAEGEAMAMTMPVEIESGGAAASTMSFVLPKRNAAAPPTPDAGSGVTIEEVGARLVAVKPFAGIVTDEEVGRQLEKLRAAVAADGGVRPLDADAYSVLQYNSPITVPWRRRNELALVVVEECDEGAEEGCPVVSWYDSGVRLA